MKLRHLLLGRKVMTNLDSILKIRDITLPTKVRLVKAMVFPVVMYGCESWTVKKAEHRRIDAFEVWCCRRLLRVPWTARRSNQSILKEISPECSLEGLMLKLKFKYLVTWCEQLTHLKRPWCWERLKAGGKGDDRGWDGWMVSPTQWTWVWVNFGSWIDREAWCAAVHGVAKSWTRLSDWTELNWTLITMFPSCRTSQSLWNFNVVSHIFENHLTTHLFSWGAFSANSIQWNSDLSKPFPHTKQNYFC